MSGCTIKGETADVDGNYTLGRPWGRGTPVALWINTVMEAQPSAIGWNEMSDGWPKRFAEYSSVTSTGTVIDLSGRKTVFAGTHTNNPVLTAEEAAQYTIETVMGDDDGWDPTADTEQASAPTGVKIDKDAKALVWDNNDYVLLWAVCKDGKVVDFTLEPSYKVEDAEAEWSVRAANQMGGLGEAAPAVLATGIDMIDGDTSGRVAGTEIYNMNGVRIAKLQRGVNIIVRKMADGTTRTQKIVVE